MSDQRETTDQLDLFRQPAEPERVVEIVPEPSTGPTEIIRGPYQLSDPAENTVGYFHGPDAQAPETERGAAVAVYPRTGTARLRVLEHLMEQRARGATDEETALALGMRLYTAAPRRKELVDGGWAEDSGQRRPTTTGSLATVWTITIAGAAEWGTRRSRPAAGQMTELAGETWEDAFGDAA